VASFTLIRRLASMSQPPIVRVHLAVVDSTNAYARAHAAAFDARALTVITADEQTAGRGRGGRAWSSSGANDIKMTFSFELPAAAAARAYLLSPLVAVAAVRALRARGVVGVGLKWPNDVVVGGARKVGGILCEAEGVAGGALRVALGIGLNVNSLPETLAVPRAIWPLSTLRAEAGGARLDVRALTDALVDDFARALAVFSARGWMPFVAEFSAASVLLGRRVRFSEDTPRAGAAAPGAAVEGVVVGFGDDGALRLRTDAGDERGFFAGEVCGLELADGAVVSGAPDDAP
jgi:BirA family biotin operon repressor/biotin-[acetyl-CoA-carboxylase] ligase